MHYGQQINRRIVILAFLIAVLPASNGKADDRQILSADSTGDRKTAIKKALSYLSKEVPAWDKQNKCFSCHNNGDAARTLLIALQRGHENVAPALTETNRWLQQPRNWDKNRGQPEFSDQQLADIQFALALMERRPNKKLTGADVEMVALARVIRWQSETGQWKVAEKQEVGSPVTYGPLLATVLVRDAAVRVDSKRYANAVHRADEWLARQIPENVFSAAALMSSDQVAKNPAQRNACLNLIGQGVDPSGGWGPYVNSPAEPFDTALVILALIRNRMTNQYAKQIISAELFLCKTQQADGSWPETTRPRGETSYAHRLSTTAWVTHALIVLENVD